MLKIRLNLKGKKKKPIFNIIVANSKTTRNGKFLDKLGFYDPRFKNNFNIDLKKLIIWKKSGAQINNSVKKLIKSLKNFNESIK